MVGISDVATWTDHRVGLDRDALRGADPGAFAKRRAIAQLNCAGYTLDVAARAYLRGIAQREPTWIDDGYAPVNDCSTASMQSAQAPVQSAQASGTPLKHAQTT